MTPRSEHRPPATAVPRTGAAGFLRALDRLDTLELAEQTRTITSGVSR